MGIHFYLLKLWAAAFQVGGKPARVFAVNQLNGTADAFLGRCFLEGTYSHGKRCGKGSIYRGFTAVLCLSSYKAEEDVKIDEML